MVRFLAPSVKCIFLKCIVSDIFGVWMVISEWILMSQWAFHDKCICVVVPHAALALGCTSPSSNGLSGGHTHLVAHLILLWRDIQSWASLAVVFGSGPKETRSVYSFITMLPSKPQTHPVAGIGADRFLHINQFQLTRVVFSMPWARMFSTCSVHDDHNVTDPVLDTCVDVSQVWSVKLEQEVEKNKALTEALQILATEHHDLKESFRRNRRSSTLSAATEDNFYDALSGQSPPDNSHLGLMCVGWGQDTINLDFAVDFVACSLAYFHRCCGKIIYIKYTISFCKQLTKLT